jgi:tetratricopeptide (TPR) repeat protein
MLVALLLAAACPRPASAGEIGPWEECITAGIKKQNDVGKQVSGDAIVREAERLASRPSDDAEKVCRIYLLARAYGLRNNAAKGDRAQARQTYAEVLRLAPSCYFAYRDLAMLDVAETPPNLLSAEQNLKRALKDNPNYTDALRGLVVLYVKLQSRFADAVVPLRRLVDLEPQDLEARNQLLRCYLELKRFGEARRALERLLKDDRKNIGYLAWDAKLDLEEGNLGSAKTKYRALAAENPSVAMLFQGYLQALEREKDAGRAIDPSEWQWGLGGLLRLEKDAERRKKIQGAIDQLNEPPKSATANGPPTEEQLIQLTRHEKEEVRIAALKYVHGGILGAAQPLSPALLKAVMERLGPERETCPAVRVWALRVLGLGGGRGLVGLVRHSLADVASDVRLAAVDTLARMTEESPAETRGGVLLILGLRAADADVATAAAARAVTLRLGSGSLPEPGEGEADTEARARSLFEAWWAGPAGVDAKIRGLSTYASLRDLFPEDVLLPYLDDPDFFVFRAAYAALAEASDTVKAPGDARRKAWLGQIPRFTAAELVPAEHRAVRQKLESWLALRPRAAGR